MPSKNKTSPQKRPLKNSPAEAPGVLFDRMANILEQARANVVRVVNSNMVLAYWLIGREIVQEVQGGKERAAYRWRLIKELSQRLGERYGRGFSVTNLQDFRLFHLKYASRMPAIQRNRCIKSDETSIGHLECAQFESQAIRYPVGIEFAGIQISRPLGAKLVLPENGRPVGDELLVGFSLQLNWSHYRAQMRVEKMEARDFYEQENRSELSADPS